MISEFLCTDNTLFHQSLAVENKTTLSKLQKKRIIANIVSLFADGYTDMFDAIRFCDIHHWIPLRSYGSTGPSAMVNFMKGRKSIETVMDRMYQKVLELVLRYQISNENRKYAVLYRFVIKQLAAFKKCFVVNILPLVNDKTIKMKCIWQRTYMAVTMEKQLFVNMYVMDEFYH